MAIVLHQELAESSIENYDAVAERIRIDSDPPEGLIVHSASPMEGGGVRIVDIWESQEDLERFEEERLMPAVREVLGDPGGPAQRRDITQIHHLVTA